MAHIVILLGGLLRTFVIQVLWGWFVTPKFGIPAPGYFMTYGVQLVVQLLTHPLRIAERDKRLDDNGEAAVAVILPLFSLGIGWIAKLLM